ncbi:SnoaL-like domain-containing protein [Filomicrobium insigne]|uniref:SnoaL-like domain-containing protein n=1 Tax=Filomicrobium insigne TaxID=418854 RepID=A0A1H0S8K5_9HYPH|nr:nuclear transport factor 2 family protein [Filomicrobium insigne]SDP38103.1 SnoaL-like domain-containing protein [Filomicrobium insigne]
MHLPPAIQAYFDADKAHDGESLIQAFAPDAVVRDEGQLYAGHQAIVAWWRHAKAKYQHTAEPIDMDRKSDVTEVRARVTGQFPGSPATLKFAFRIEGDRVVDLEIGA